LLLDADGALWATDGCGPSPVGLLGWDDVDTHHAGPVFAAVEQCRRQHVATAVSLAYLSIDADLHVGSSSVLRGRELHWHAQWSTKQVNVVLLVGEARGQPHVGGRVEQRVQGDRGAGAG